MMRFGASVAAVVAVAAAAGCGGDPGAPSPPAGAEPVGTEVAGSVVQFADCGDWREGTKAERQATVVALRGQLTPQGSKTAASPLPDERAYALLEKTCSTGNVESLRLYKLYARMQGFAPLMLE
jgi:hypothetical protein